MSTSIASSFEFSDASQSSQLEAWKKLFAPEEMAETFEEFEKVLDGDDCRADDGSAQKE